MVATEFELAGEFEDGLEEAVELELLLPSRETRTSALSRCPSDRPNTVRGFKRYSSATNLLPPSQWRKLAVIAGEIGRSQTGPAPVVRVMLVGHADLDPVRESREPGFMLRKSQQRAEAIVSDLRRRVGQSVAARITWVPTGRGATALAVPHPRTETERECNRRVDIFLARRHLGDRHSCGAPVYPARSPAQFEAALSPSRESEIHARRRAIQPRLSLFQESTSTIDRNHFNCGAARWASHISAFMNPNAPSCPLRVGPTPYSTGKDIIRAIDEAYQCLSQRRLEIIHIFSHSGYYGLFGPSGQIGGLYRAQTDNPDRPNGGRTVTDIPTNQLANNVIFVLHGCNTANIEPPHGGDNLCRVLFLHLRGSLDNPRVFGHFNTGCASRDDSWREYSNASPNGTRTRRSLSPIYRALPDARGHRCCTRRP